MALKKQLDDNDEARADDRKPSKAPANRTIRQFSDLTAVSRESPPARLQIGEAKLTPPRPGMTAELSAAVVRALIGDTSSDLEICRLFLGNGSKFARFSPALSGVRTPL